MAFVVKTSFKGADRLTPLLKKIGGRAEITGRRIDRSFKRATKSVSIFSGVLKGALVAGAIQRAAMGASMAIRGLGEEYIEFDRNLTKAITRLPGRLDRGSKAFKQFGDVARREAKRTEFTAGEAALAVEQLALAGFNLEKTTAALPGVLNLATNADVELADATRMATKTLGAFGLNVKSTEQTVKNLTRVNDVFSTTVSSASITMEDLFEVMKFGGPPAKAAGQSIETFAAVAGVLADSAIDASVAGTSLRSMFINLAAPTPKATKLLKKMRVEVKDSQGNFKNFFDILADVEKSTKKMGNAQKLAALNTLFGKRAVNAANVLLDKGTDGLKKYRKALENSTGASAKMAKTIRTSIEGRVKRLKSALIDLGFKFIEAFNKNGGKSIEALIKKVEKFDVKPVVEGLKDVIRTSKELFFIIKPFLSFLPAIIAMWAAYKAVLIGITIVQAAKFFVDLAIAIKAASQAQGVLNLIMAANPIGLVTIAIVGLVGALTILISKNEDVSASWESMFADIASFAAKMVSKVTGLIASLIETMRGIPIIGDMFEKPAQVMRKSQQIWGNISKEQARLSEEILVENAGLGVQREYDPTRLIERQRKITETRLSAAQINPFLRGVDQRKKAQGAIGQGILNLNPILSKVRSPAFAAARQPQAPAPPVPPNRSEVEAKQQMLKGTIGFENAPKGTTFKPEKGPGLVPLTSEGLGAN